MCGRSSGPAALQDDWAMTNAIEAGQAAEALRQLALMLDAGAPAEKILGQLGWLVRTKFPALAPARRRGRRSRRCSGRTWISSDRPATRASCSNAWSSNCVRGSGRGAPLVGSGANAGVTRAAAHGALLARAMRVVRRDL